MSEIQKVNPRNLDAYIDSKLRRANSMNVDFAALFALMFSERDHVFWETNDGYSILKTTYGACADRILLRAATLSEKLAGIPQDAVIGLYMENSLAWIELFWCILLCGYRPLLLNLRMTDGMLCGALESVAAAAVITEGKEFPCQTLFTREIGAAEAPLQAGACGSEILLMSSGTSGSIKICAYTAKEILAQVANAVSIIKENKRMKQHYEGSIKQLTLLPFYHVFGLFAVYFWFGFFSRTFVHLPNLQPDTVLNTVRKHKVTHLFAVPMFWDTVYRSAMRTIRAQGKQEKFEKGMRIARKLGDTPVLAKAFSKIAFREVREKMFGESIQFCISGGSAMRTETLEFFNAIGYHLANGYGMTEIGITSVELSEKKRVLNSGSIGHPMSSVRYKTAPDGVLTVSGASVAHAIIEAGTRRELAEQTVCTNDLVRKEGERYFVLGRRDDVIISPNGENLNPDVMEGQLDLPEAQGFCIIPVTEREGTIPVLIVSVSPYCAAGKRKRLAERVREQLSNMAGQIGRVVFVTDPLTRPEEIKVNRKRLAQRYAAGELHSAEDTAETGEAVRTMLEQRVAQLFAETLDRDAVALHMDSDFFLNEGGTSIDYYVLLGKLRDEFDVDLFGEAPQSTVRDLCARLEEKLKE